MAPESDAVAAEVGFKFEEGMVSISIYLLLLEEDETVFSVLLGLFPRAGVKACCDG